jgi:hypothetical protein
VTGRFPWCRTYIDPLIDPPVTQGAPAPAPFGVGQCVIRRTVPGVGPIRGGIRNIRRVAAGGLDPDSGKYRGAWIVNLDDGNYGGADLFEALAAL